MGVYPIAMVAHPQKSAQFAVGFSNGRVYVFEPAKQGGKWSLLPSDDKESGKTMLEKSQMNRKGKSHYINNNLAPISA